jgi:DNA (cytosine-5)-methyltransferase 1
VFVVGYLGDWRPAAAVLFERHSLSGHPAPSREKREDPAKCLTRGAGQRYDFETEDLIPQPIVVDRAAFNQGENAQYQFRAEYSETMDSLVARGPHAVLQPAYGIPGNWIGRKPENGGNATEPMHDIAPCLTKADQHGVAQPICLMDQGGSVMNIEHDMTGTLRRETHGHEPIVMQAVVAPTLTAANDPSRSPQSSEVTNQVYSVYQSSMSVRRLTPKECERLQGFGDNYTDIQAKGKPTPDGPRYKALGNSMAVPVMAWIGQRIEQVEAICKQNK